MHTSQFPKINTGLVLHGHIHYKPKVLAPPSIESFDYFTFIIWTKVLAPFFRREKGTSKLCQQRWKHNSCT